MAVVLTPVQIKQIRRNIHKGNNRKTQEIEVCILLRLYDRASLIYSSTTNNMQRYTMVFITINVVNVSGGSSAHHQELNTVYTAFIVISIIA